MDDFDGTLDSQEFHQVRACVCDSSARDVCWYVWAWLKMRFAPYFPTTFTLATADTTTNRNRKSIRVSMGEHVTLPDQSCTRLVVVSAACCLLDHFSFCPRLCTCVVLHVYPIPTLKLTLSLPTENLRVQNIQGGLECVRHGEMVSLWWRSYDGIHMNQGG